jgi:hypothetical protein
MKTPDRSLYSAGTLDRGIDVRRSAVSVSYQSGTEPTITVEGVLDGSAARDIAAVFREVLREWPTKVDLDLRGVTDFTTPGAVAVSDCLSVGKRLDEGINVQVATDAGCAALLQSMELV